MTLAKSITNLSEYLTWIEGVYGKWKTKKHLFFRGISCNKWLLTPSVFRHAQLNEKEIFLDFKQYAPAQGLQYDYLHDRDKMLADMQHYGLPTRLLDWTLAPLHALFFACNKEDKSTGKCDTDKNDYARIWAFNPWSYWSKVVGVKKPTEIHQIHIYARCLFASGWTTDAIKKYVKKRYHYKGLKSKDLQNPFPFVSTFSNPRILHQRGAFTIHGSDQGPLETNSLASQYLHHVDIPFSACKSIINELNFLYINEYSIYPDFDGMRKLVKAKGSLFNV